MQDVAPDQLHPSYAERLPVPWMPACRIRKLRVSRRQNNTPMFSRCEAVRPWPHEV
jgi:hypothetical protein